MWLLLASCGIQSLYKPFPGVIANLVGLVDKDMRNAHPEFLLQVCVRHSVPSNLLKDYVSNRDAWYAFVLDKVNGNPAPRANLDAKETPRRSPGRTSRSYSSVFCTKKALDRGTRRTTLKAISERSKNWKRRLSE